jgi:hypothetical protein
MTNLAGSLLARYQVRPATSAPGRTGRRPARSRSGSCPSRTPSQAQRRKNAQSSSADTCSAMPGNKNHSITRSTAVGQPGRSPGQRTADRRHDQLRHPVGRGPGHSPGEGRAPVVTDDRGPGPHRAHPGDPRDQLPACAPITEDMAAGLPSAQDTSRSRAPGTRCPPSPAVRAAPPPWRRPWSPVPRPPAAHRLPGTTRTRPAS